MVSNLVNEREQRKNETMSEITGKWGTNQTITGPVLLIPYAKSVLTRSSEITQTTGYFQIMPSSLSVESKIDTEPKKRGIYKILTYTSISEINGSFKAEDFTAWPDNYSEIFWEDAFIAIGITDLRGITKSADFRWNDSVVNFLPGESHCSLFNSGIHAKVAVNQGKDYNFQIKLELNGTGSFFISPVANETQAKIAGDWPDPSFDGAFLPNPREVNDSGFSATWSTNHMNRPYPQVITADRSVNLSDFQDFGVRLMFPVDTYQKSTRSVKYAFLFIALTFMVLFFVEITTKKKIHPIQYLIVGIALVIFYSLLISLAEHFSFNLAYLFASVVIVAMSTAYVHSLLKNSRITLILCTILTLLYVFLFTVLQIADYALLLGNIGLVIILGIIMIFSGKVDWYGTRKNKLNQENTLTN